MNDKVCEIGDETADAASKPSPSSSQEKPSRGSWNSDTQFIMACVSFAVGLGNIWRFPALVYEHNGGAFLIPYLCCSFLVGFPMLYLELSLGQFVRVGPAVAYGRIWPLFQGLGWAMIWMALLVSIYYNLLVGWVLFYIYKIVIGDSWQWSSCVNDFNTPYCVSTLEDARCSREFSPTAIFFNGTCQMNTTLERAQFFVSNNITPLSPAEEFFENYVLERGTSIDEFGGFNLKIVIAYAVAWTITALVLFKGVELIGKVAIFTSTVPYLIIVILFVRSVTLDGAIEGLNFYILKPDFRTIWSPAAWRAAATQVSYSLSVGFGGILSLSSYNPLDHNCFKDAAIITIADAGMSIFGGTAVFSVLGYLAKQLDLRIDQVVQSGTSLAFIAYPEALSRMPLSGLWAFLFFFMLFTLGISSQFGFAECICTALRDQFQVFRRNQTLTAFGVCTVLYACGLILCTRAGIYYFNIFNDYSSSFALTIALFLECLLVFYLYGYENYIADLRSMFGAPESWFGRVFGLTGHYISFAWRFLCPVQAVIISVFSLITQIGNNLTYGKGNRMYTYPTWCLWLGWTLSVLPLFWLPIFALFRAYGFKKSGKSLRELCRVQPKWPSYARLRGGNRSTTDQSGKKSSASSISVLMRSKVFPAMPTDHLNHGAWFFDENISGKRSNNSHRSNEHKQTKV